MAIQSQQQNRTLSFVMFPASECIAWVTVFGMEAVVIVALNALTIIVYLRKGSLRKRSMYLVINQAVADMFVGAILISEVCTLGDYCGFWNISYFWKHFLRVFRILYFVFSPVSFTNLTAISLERAHATFRPLKHRLLKKKILRAVIAAVWITGCLFAIIRVLYEIQILTFERYKPFLTSCILFFSFCLLSIVVSYSSIAIKIVCGTQPHHHGTTNRERKLTKTLFIVTVTSLLLVLPTIIFQFLLPTSTIISRTLYRRLRLSFLVLFYANCLVNPVVYAFKMPEFRRALFSFLPCRSQPQLSAPVFNLNEM